MKANKSASTFARPHTIIWLAIPLIILLGLFTSSQALDFQFYDTYYVVGNMQYALAVATFFWFLGMIYWTVQKAGKSPNLVLAYIHLVATVAVLAVLAVPALSISRSYGAFLAVAAVFVLAQVICLGNTVSAFFRK